MDSLFYIVSILLVYVLFFILKKQDKKASFIPMIIITFLSLLAYQVLICWLLSLLNISINLINLSIINVIISILLGFIIKKNGMQNFYINKSDIIISFVFIIIFSFIVYQNIGKLDSIRYFTTDASIHYIAAKEFYQNDQMLYETNDTETSKQMMPLAYVNVGILFKVFEPIIREINFYKIFLLFDVVILFFSVILFYFILKQKVENKWHMLLAAIIAIIYTLGYPLNNFLAGFYYLGMGILIINGIIYCIGLEEKRPNAKRLLLFLLNTGVIFSYSLFTPVVYLSIFIYDMIKMYNKHKKLLNKEFIINTIITLIIPGILGVIYLLAPNISMIKHIATEGYIYKNLFVNIIFFLPFVIYLLVKQIIEIKSKKKIEYKFIYFITLIVYMLILYIGMKSQKVSQYYFFKNAYILWGILIIYFFEGIIEFVKKYKDYIIIPVIYVVCYVFFLALTLITLTHFLSIYDIYENNIFMIEQRKNLTEDDLKILEYVYENDILSKTENNTLIIGDFMQEAWIRSIFKYRNRYPLEKANHVSYIKKWNNGETKYLICFEKSLTYPKIEKAINFKDCTLIFSTENAKIYSK